jgi:hypothetical protein
MMANLSCWRWAFSLLAAALSLPAISVSANGPRPGSLRELLDLRALPTHKPWQTWQSSSHDPSGGFYDSGHFQRLENDRKLVLLDTPGPGCLDRFWFTRKTPDREPYEIWIHVDDDLEPRVRLDLDRMFSGQQAPWLKPLVGTCGLSRAPGQYAYLPVGFQKRCRVFLVPTAADQQYQWRTTETGERIRHVYYQITYRRFAAETTVHPFEANWVPGERAAFEEVRKLWNRAGSSPWSSVEGITTTTRLTDLDGGRDATLFEIAGPAVGYELRLTVRPSTTVADQLESLADGLDIEIHWDGAEKPQISAPLGTFFASPDFRHDVTSLLIGCQRGSYFCFLPMPFARNAKLRICNRSDVSVQVQAQWSYRREELRPTDHYLCCHSYDITAPTPGKDYVPLNETGRGHVVAIIMDRPGQMEGDDRWWIDDASSPSIHGTGTEDFFNFAWGLSGMQALPIHGMTQHFGRPVGYRFLVPYGVPYERSIRLTWEHGHTWRQRPNQDLGRYSGAVLFYAQPDANVRMQP